MVRINFVSPSSKFHIGGRGQISESRIILKQWSRESSGIWQKHSLDNSVSSIKWAEEIC